MKPSSFDIAWKGRPDPLFSAIARMGTQWQRCHGLASRNGPIRSEFNQTVRGKRFYLRSSQQSCISNSRGSVRSGYNCQHLNIGRMPYSSSATPRAVHNNYNKNGQSRKARESHVGLQDSLPRPQSVSLYPHTNTTVEDRTAIKLELADPLPPEHALTPRFWSHRMYKGEDGNDITVHYCKTLKSTEEITQHFLDDRILGFDMEWKAQASRWDSIQDNASLIQLANRNRIALFQVSQFRPAKNPKDLVPPSLRRILESSDITKVGVSIKADRTRLRKYLRIDTRGIFELSHLYTLVRYCQSDPSQINKRPVSLSKQVEEHFGLPLEKDENVRCSDWSSALNYRQVQYAAADPYACIRLFEIMNAKRQALDPSPPLPALADVNLPIRVVKDATINTGPDDVDVHTAGIVSKESWKRSSCT